MGQELETVARIPSNVIKPSVDIYAFHCNMQYDFLAVLLSPILDGFDQLCKLFTPLSLVSINKATSELFGNRGSNPGQLG